jgi:uncharacterized RmlC-like cupin family protein
MSNAVNKLIKPGDPEDHFRERMIAACPVGAEVYKFMTVAMNAGDCIKAHRHAHHLVMYYPVDAGPIIVTPTAGTMLYLPPGTLHEVPVVKKDRLSVAMLFNKVKGKPPCK